MMKLPLIMAATASGLLLPAQAPHSFPKPAIIKPENVEFSTHMLLCMPLTMGAIAKSARSTVSYVGSGTTMPAHQIGDLIIGIATRLNATPPTIGNGYTNLGSQNTTSYSARIGYKIASSTSEGMGTWLNSQALSVHVYRGSPGPGAVAGAAANQNTATTPALTLTVQNGTSWVLGLVGLATTSSGTPNAPTGTTSRFNASFHRAWDSNAGVSGTTFGATSSSMTSQHFASGVVEILSN